MRMALLGLSDKFLAMYRKDKQAKDKLAQKKAKLRKQQDVKYFRDINKITFIVKFAI